MELIAHTRNTAPIRKYGPIRALRLPPRRAPKATTSSFNERCARSPLRAALRGRMRQFSGLCRRTLTPGLTTTSLWGLVIRSLSLSFSGSEKAKISRGLAPHTIIGPEPSQPMVLHRPGAQTRGGSARQGVAGATSLRRCVAGREKSRKGVEDAIAPLDLEVTSRDLARLVFSILIPTF